MLCLIYTDTCGCHRLCDSEVQARTGGNAWRTLHATDGCNSLIACTLMSLFPGNKASAICTHSTNSALALAIIIPRISAYAS